MVVSFYEVIRSTDLTTVPASAAAAASLMRSKS